MLVLSSGIPAIPTCCERTHLSINRFNISGFAHDFPIVPYNILSGSLLSRLTQDLHYESCATEMEAAAVTVSTRRLLQLQFI